VKPYGAGHVLGGKIPPISGGLTLFILEAIVGLTILLVAISVAMLLLKFVFAVVMIPVKILFFLTKGLLGLLLFIPVLFIFGAVVTAVVPIGLIFLLLPVLAIGGITYGLFCLV
jgi:hypothetical protein